MKFSFAPLLFSLVTFSQAFGQESTASPAEVVARVKAAADTLIESLDPGQRDKLLFDFNNDEQRHRWSNLPNGMYPRAGLRWGNLNKQQKDAVMGLLKATLSPRGVQQIVDNMEGDEVLKRGASGGGGGPDFGEDAYYLSILGKPSTTKPWMWQFGGHHLGINATIVGDQITLAPSLTGGQPVDYEFEGRKVRQLAGEEDMSFELIGSLTSEQLQVTVLDEHFANMIWGPGKEGAQPKQQGINVSKLSDQQQKLLLALIRSRIGLLNSAHAELAMREIKDNLSETWFAWFGPTKPGGASTFRIQGPMILMEYAPQHLGGDGTEHTHAMYRDPTNDYGRPVPQATDQ